MLLSFKSLSPLLIYKSYSNVGSPVKMNMGFVAPCTGDNGSCASVNNPAAADGSASTPPEQGLNKTHYEVMWRNHTSNTICMLCPHWRAPQTIPIVIGQIIEVSNITEPNVFQEKPWSVSKLLVWNFYNVDKGLIC